MKSIIVHNEENKKIPQLNRRQKRNLSKILRIPVSEIEKIFSPHISDVKWEKFTDDSIVTLNYDRIMSQDGLGEKYKEWVEEHKDMELTAYQDEEHRDTALYCMREDTNEFPWLFDISDLNLIKMNGADRFEISTEEAIDETKEPVEEAEETIGEKGAYISEIEAATEGIGES